MTTRSFVQIKRLDSSTRRPWKYDVDAKKPRFKTSQIRKLDEISRFLLETGSAVQPPKSGGGIVLGDFLEWNSPSFHLINTSGMSGFYGFYGFSGFFRILRIFRIHPVSERAASHSHQFVSALIPHQPALSELRWSVVSDLRNPVFSVPRFVRRCLACAIGWGHRYNINPIEGSYS